MKYLRIYMLLTLILLLSISLTIPAAAKSEGVNRHVSGHFSPGGMVLTITSQSKSETLLGLGIDYCDGSHEDLRGYFPSKMVFRPLLFGKGYSYYAEKPMKRAAIRTLFINDKGVAAPDFSVNLVQRKCGDPDPPPKLYCNNVQVAPVIHRSWAGTPIQFKSTRHIVRAALRFPGIDGLAPARQYSTYPLIYVPSVRFNPVERTWTGTFISGLVPLGDYEKVELIVKDDFGQQAKCPVGKITVEP